MPLIILNASFEKNACDLFILHVRLHKRTMQKDIFLQENVTVCIQYILHGKNTVDYGEAFREGSQKKNAQT